MSILPFASPSAFLSDQTLIPDFQETLFYAQRQHPATWEAIMAGEGSRAEALTREHTRQALTNYKHLQKAGTSLV